MNWFPNRDSHESSSDGIDFDVEVTATITCDSADMPRAIMALMDKMEAIYATKQQAFDLRLEDLDRRAGFLTNNSFEGKSPNGKSTNANGNNHGKPKGGGPPGSQKVTDE